MSGAPDKAFDPTTTFVDLTPGDGARPIPVTPDFWERLGSGALTFEGRMVSAHRMSADWGHWEMHPRGEELLILTAGAIDLILDEAGGERRIRLEDRAGFIIPRGVWHRADGARLPR